MHAGWSVPLALLERLGMPQYTAYRTRADAAGISTDPLPRIVRTGGRRARWCTRRRQDQPRSVPRQQEEIARVAFSDAVPHAEQAEAAEQRARRNVGDRRSHLVEQPPQARQEDLSGPAVEPDGRAWPGQKRNCRSLSWGTQTPCVLLIHCVSSRLVQPSRCIESPVRVPSLRPSVLMILPDVRRCDGDAIVAVEPLERVTEALVDLVVPRVPPTRRTASLKGRDGVVCQPHHQGTQGNGLPDRTGLPSATMNWCAVGHACRRCRSTRDQIAQRRGPPRSAWRR